MLMGICKIMEKPREAVIHFELYRLLKNCLVSGGYSDIKVEPEHPVKGRSADLVLTRVVSGKDEKHLLVIEVKTGINENSAYDPRARDQVKAYADHLNADYCAVTNGRFLILFKNTGENLGYYNFELSENCVRRFLDELFEMIAGKRKRLSLKRAKSMEEIEKSAKGFALAIKDVLESLADQPYFRIEKEVKEKTEMFYLTVGKFKRVFRLGIPISPKGKPGVDIRLNTLKRKFDLATVEKILQELSKVQGFEWIKDCNIEREFVWKYLTPSREVNAEELKEGLTNWFQKLSTLENVESF